MYHWIPLPVTAGLPWIVSFRVIVTIGNGLHILSSWGFLSLGSRQTNSRQGQQQLGFKSKTFLF